VQQRLRRHIRTWALLTLPATFLHELAHLVLGLMLGAKPSSFSLWPKRVGVAAWRLGAVGFIGLTRWNSGAIALAPLLWLLLCIALFRAAPSLPEQLSLQQCILGGVALVWLWIAVAPGRSDWQMAREYWASAGLFLSVWGSAGYWLLDYR
jgi:hypothetical protein